MKYDDVNQTVVVDANITTLQYQPQGHVFRVLSQVIWESCPYKLSVFSGRRNSCFVFLSHIRTGDALTAVSVAFRQAIDITVVPQNSGGFRHKQCEPLLFFFPSLLHVPGEGGVGDDHRGVGAVCYQRQTDRWQTMRQCFPAPSMVVIAIGTQSRCCTLRPPRLVIWCFPLRRRQTNLVGRTIFTSFVDRHKPTKN